MDKRAPVSCQHKIEKVIGQRLKLVLALDPRSSEGIRELSVVFSLQSGNLEGNVCPHIKGQD